MHDDPGSAMIVPLIRNPDISMKFDILRPPGQNIFILRELCAMKCFKGPRGTMPPCRRSLIESIDFFHHLYRLFEWEVSFVYFLEKFAGAGADFADLVVFFL